MLVQGASAENAKIPSQHHINVTYRYQVCTGRAVRPRSHLRTILVLHPRMSRGSHHSHHLRWKHNRELYSRPLSSSSQPLLTFRQLHKSFEQGFLVSQQKRVMMVLCPAPFLDFQSKSARWSKLSISRYQMTSWRRDRRGIGTQVCGYTGPGHGHQVATKHHPPASGHSLNKSPGHFVSGQNIEQMQPRVFCFLSLPIYSVWQVSLQ